MARLTILTTLLLSIILCGVNAFVVRPPASALSRPTSLFAREGDKEGGAAIAKPKIKTDIKTKEKVKEKQVVKKKARVNEPKVRRDQFCLLSLPYSFVSCPTNLSLANAQLLQSRRKEEFEDAPLFKVMLIGDDSYDAGHVIDRLCAIIDDLDEGAAATVFQQAQQEGKAMCGKYPMEHGEMYKEQLIRSDPMIFADLEEENK